MQSFNAFVQKVQSHMKKNNISYFGDVKLLTVSSIIWRQLWIIEVIYQWNGDILKWWYGEMVLCQNGEMVKCRNGGMVKRWNGKIMTYINNVKVKWWNKLVHYICYVLVCHREIMV